MSDYISEIIFQSTLSMRRATKRAKQARHRKPISIHALHEESDGECGGFRIRRVISIHALHEESDLNPRCISAMKEISIHALHEESDLKTDYLPVPIWVFQSTLSMRRATVQLDIFVRFLRCKPAA